MKLSIIITFFAAASATAEEASLRKRELAEIGGNINVPTCFSEIASVQVFGRGSVDMKDLQVGDRIFTGETYQPVYAFAHMDKTTKADFVQIQTEKGNSLEATGAHLVYVDSKASPVRADSIQVGDTLQGAVVTKIDTVQRAGLYAPLTTDGKLIVDGVKASNYVSLEQADDHVLFGQNVHGFSHFGISPFRLFCTGVSSTMCESYTEEGIPRVLASVYQFFDWFTGLPVFFQALVTAAYLVVAAVSWTLECLLLNPAVVPSMMVAGAGFFASSRAFGVRFQTNKVKTI